MAKLTQAEIKTKVDEWAGYGWKIQQAESKRDIELAPMVAEFEEKTAPVREKHDRKISGLVEKRAAVEGELLEYLNAVGKPVTIAGEIAVAAVELKVGSRVIDVAKFFEQVKDKNAAFWGCISVAIAKAEKLVGKDKIDAISSKESKLVPALKVKS